MFTVLPEVSGTGMEVLQNHKSPGYCGTGVHNPQKFRAGTTSVVPVPRVHRSYRTHRRSGYGYECPTEVIKIPGTGMKDLQNLQKFRVLAYITCRSFGYGYESR